MLKITKEMGLLDTLKAKIGGQTATASSYECLAVGASLSQKVRKKKYPAQDAENEISEKYKSSVLLVTF